MDVRSEASVEAAVARAASRFGGIDALVANAGALSLRGTERTSAARFDLLFETNVRGAFLCTRCCLKHLKKSASPHVLAIAPPLGLDPKWLAPHLPYTLSKYGMSLCVIGWAEEFRPSGIAVSALWPKTTIATSALNLLGGEAAIRTARKPQIVADAAREILLMPPAACTGRFFIDEDVLRESGVTDFSGYSVDPSREPSKDLFVE
jgi:citronellol/citronellal dehydrogenase